MTLTQMLANWFSQIREAGVWIILIIGSVSLIVQGSKTQFNLVLVLKQAAYVSCALVIFLGLQSIANMVKSEANRGGINTGGTGAGTYGLLAPYLNDAAHFMTTALAYFTHF